MSRKHRAPAPPGPRGRPAPADDPRRRGHEWAFAYPRCRQCGTTVRPHLADGYCVDCWRRERGLAPTAAERVPVCDRDGRVLGGLSIAMAYPTKEELLDAALMEP